VVKEGTVIRKGKDGRPEVVILGFIPADQRRFSLQFCFQPFSIHHEYRRTKWREGLCHGFVLQKQSGKVLGPERVAKLKAFKNKIDVKGIFNPGKVIGYGLLDAAMSLGGALEPFSRPLGNHVITQIGERPSYRYAISRRMWRGMPMDVHSAAIAWKNAINITGAAGKARARAANGTGCVNIWKVCRVESDAGGYFLVCTTCELCNLRCSARCRIEPSWMKLRGMLIEEQKRMTFPPFEMMAEALRTQGNIGRAIGKNRSDWFPEDLKEKHGRGVNRPFCILQVARQAMVEHDIAMATVRLLDKAGVDFVYAGNPENCCGTPMLVAGKWESLRKP